MADGSKPRLQGGLAPLLWTPPEPWSWSPSLWVAGVGSATAPALGGKYILGKHLPCKASGAVATEMLDNREHLSACGTYIPMFVQW